MLSPNNFTPHLLGWYDIHQRPMPWRLPRGSGPDAKLDPYHVLVSELMLQQTQVATVIPYFHRFIALFPTPARLATADVHDVLHAWQGLGYYSRARNLQRAAAAIVERFNGVVPSSVEDLLTLPGVGRYTAGAVASLAYGQRAPILDGNVARVLCRLDAVIDDPRKPAVRDRLWSRAEAILPKARLADFNSALMELGATVCTPRSPKCLMCPVRTHCEAAERGIQELIPVRKPASKTSLHRRWVFGVEHDGRYLIEQRPPTGRWAGLWQLVTVRAEKQKAAEVASAMFELLSKKPIKRGRVLHALTHRRYQFDVYVTSARVAVEPAENQRWVTIQQMASFAMSVPQQKAVKLLEAH